jgi:hypothetical protein
MAVKGTMKMTTWMKLKMARADGGDPVYGHWIFKN